MPHMSPDALEIWAADGANADEEESYWDLDSADADAEDDAVDTEDDFNYEGAEAGDPGQPQTEEVAKLMGIQKRIACIVQRIDMLSMSMHQMQQSLQQLPAAVTKVATNKLLPAEKQEANYVDAPEHKAELEIHMPNSVMDADAQSQGDSENEPPLAVDEAEAENKLELELELQVERLGDSVACQTFAHD